MEDLKITVEIKNSLGNGVGYEYDLDVISPYLDEIIKYFSDIQQIQIAKDEAKIYDSIFNKIMAEINKKKPKPKAKAKNHKKTAKEELDEICKQVDNIFGDNGWKVANGVYKTANTTVSTPIRDSKGRFAKKDSKKK